MTTRSILSKYWNNAKNGEKSLSDYKPNSNRKMWWICEKGHEWNYTINQVSNKKGEPCPYCSGSKVGYGNDLKSMEEELVKEWHPTKNIKHTPEKLFHLSTVEVWWICDKKHAWKASPSYRIKHNSGCVYCSGKIIGYGNDFESLHPKLAKEWNYSKNASKHPHMFRPGSDSKVWWMCSKGHEYEQKIINRVSRNLNCPYCSGHKVGYGNDLETQSPEIAREWDYSKNENNKPYEFTQGSRKKIWWKDRFEHSWLASIQDRTSGHGCPFCSNQSSEFEIFILSEIEWVFGKVEQRTKIDGKEVDIYIPLIKGCIEVDGSHWHKDKRISDKAKNVALKSLGYSIVRLRDKPLKKIDDDDIIISFTKDKILAVELLLNYIKTNNELPKRIQQKIKKWLKQKTQQNPNYYNKLLSYLPGPPPEKSLKHFFPKISSQWNHERNGDLKPYHLSPFSKKKVWWVCTEGHEYMAVVGNRTGKRKSGCPYCANQKVGYGNDLKSKFPGIAKEWHSTKNVDLLPEDVSPTSRIKVWWLCSKGHEFDSRISDRTRDGGLGCPFCSGHRVGYGNDLFSTHPDLMKEWDFDKNIDDPRKLRPLNPRKAWWTCPNSHSYQSIIANRVQGTGCPYCTNQKVGYGNSLYDKFPEIADEWHPTKNGALSPQDVFPSTNRILWWICKNGHEWKSSTYSRTKKHKSCKICSQLRSTPSGSEEKST